MYGITVLIKEREKVFYILETPYKKNEKNIICKI